MGKKSQSRKPSSIRDLFTEEIKPNLPVGAGKVNKEVKRVCEEPMHNPLKLVDENFEFKYTDRLRSFFKANTGFLVVGIIGRKVGTVMYYIDRLFDSFLGCGEIHCR